MKVRFALRVIAEVDGDISAQDAIDRLRGALYVHENGYDILESGNPVRVLEVESVTMEGEA